MANTHIAASLNNGFKVNSVYAFSFLVLLSSQASLVVTGWIFLGEPLLFIPASVHYTKQDTDQGKSDIMKTSVLDTANLKT